MKKHFHLALYISVVILSAYEILTGMQVLWFSITLFMSILLVATEIFFLCGPGKIINDEYNAEKAKEKAEFEKFLLDNNK